MSPDPNINPNHANLEPVEGEPGWFFDHATGQTIHESELGDLDDEMLDEEPTEEEDDSDDDQSQDSGDDSRQRSEDDSADNSETDSGDQPKGEEGDPEAPNTESEQSGAKPDMPEGAPEAANPAEALGEGATGGLEGAETLAEGAEALEAVEAAGAAVESEGILAAYLAAMPWSGIITIAVVVILALIILIAMSFFGGAEEAKADECSGGNIIVIDPGHKSESDSSTTQADYDRDKANGTGATGGEGFGVVERDINQKVANKLKTSLESAGYTVYLTKTSADDFMSNRARGRFARDKKANLYIRVHNDDGDGSPSGIVFYYPDTKKYTPTESWQPTDLKGTDEYPYRLSKDTASKDVELAKALNTAFGSENIDYSGGSKYPHQTKKLNKAFGYNYDLTTALIEMSSLQYEKDANFIKESANQDKLVKAFTAGIKEYLPAEGSGCGGINGLESPPGMKGPNSKGYYQFPKGLDVVSGLYGAGDTSCNHWGSKELNQVIYTVAKAFAAKYPKNKMQIGDFNSSGHITHSDGRDADIDIPGGMEVDGSGYNRELAIYAAKLFFETKTIKWIYYDDESVDKEINAWAKKNGYPGAMKAIGGHNNHFHVRMQDKYAGPSDAPSCP